MQSSWVGESGNIGERVESTFAPLILDKGLLFEITILTNISFDLWCFRAAENFKRNGKTVKLFAKHMKVRIFVCLL